MSRFSNVILMNYPRTQAVIYGLGASCGFALLGTALTNVNGRFILYILYFIIEILI